MICDTLPAIVRLPCWEKGCFILTVGQIENSVGMFGYNQLPNYNLDNPAEPGLAWVIEPNYRPSDGVRRMEGYLQYLAVGGKQSSVRRAIVTRINTQTGNIDATEISAGPGGWVALCIHDGTPTGGMTGAHVLTATAAGVAIHGTLTTGGQPWRILGLDTSGPIPTIAIEVDGHPLKLMLAAFTDEDISRVIGAPENPHC